jgi:hypothetical protein
MDRTEHLLSILAEECVEAAQRCTKALRFGLDEVQPGQALTNEERIWQELNDVCAAAEMLITLRGRGGLARSAVDQKKSKVEHFLAYSLQLGTLTPDKGGDTYDGERP